MYADTITKSMRKAIDETNRRRKIQDEYNKKHNITPKSIIKGVRDIIEATIVAEENISYEDNLTNEELEAMIFELEKRMIKAAEELEFEKAAQIRDTMIELKKKIVY